eukprot:1479586-Prymnesium_polylepis.1
MAIVRPSAAASRARPVRRRSICARALNGGLRARLRVDFVEEVEHAHVVERPANVVICRQVRREDLDCHPVLHQHVNEDALWDEGVCAIEGPAVARHEVPRAGRGAGAPAPSRRSSRGALRARASPARPL